MLPSTIEIPDVAVHPYFDAASCAPVISLPQAGLAVIKQEELIAAAAALASQFRPGAVDQLPIQVEVSVIVDQDVEVFHYELSQSSVVLLPGEAPLARLKVTLQRPVDFVLLQRGISLLTIIGSGRASVTGTLDDILQVFGFVRCGEQAGRRSFQELASLLLRAKASKQRQVAKLVDEFGREDFVKELLQSVIDSVVLSGMPQKLPATTLFARVSTISYLIRIAPECSELLEYSDEIPYTASIEIPKLEISVDRLLGRITDIDAIMQRKILLSGPDVDVLMPLFERISSGLSSFTFPDDPELGWVFP